MGRPHGSHRRAVGFWGKRFELTPFDEEVEKIRMRFESAVFNVFHQLLELSTFGLRKQRNARPFDRGVANLHDFSVRQMGNQADTTRCFCFQMAPKTAGQIETIDVGKSNAVIVKDDLQTSDVGAFGLRKLVDVALGEENPVGCIDRDALHVVFESAQLVHLAGAQQFAHQINQTRSADAGWRTIADDAEAECSIRVDRNTFDKRRPGPAFRRR